jgi:hypothetical protein
MGMHKYVHQMKCIRLLTAGLLAITPKRKQPNVSTKELDYYICTKVRQQSFH